MRLYNFSGHLLAFDLEGVSYTAPEYGEVSPEITGSATSVIQPSLVVYMWQRTA